MRKRRDVINYLIKKYNYKKYLEIGVSSPRRTFDQINCNYKDGVDPGGECNYKMTSNNFFKYINENQKYDIIFIDGLHLEKQAKKDILNSLDHLLSGGTIIVHDCNPREEKRQREIQVGKKWNGTVWKAFAKLRMNREDLKMYVVGIDHGIGIIQRGSQVCFPWHPDKKFTYDFLEKNRIELLNLISVREFKRILG